MAVLMLLLIGLYLFLIWPRLSKRKQMSKYKDVRFAHRGYHNIHLGIPENSMPAFSRAIAKGFGIELDLHLTRDQQLIVFHDDSLKRVCGVDKAPESLTYAQIQGLRLLGTNEQIPLFADVLALVDGQVPLLVELKAGDLDLSLCEATYQALKSYSGDYLIQSFNPLVLRWFKKNAPQILRGQLSTKMSASKVILHESYKFALTRLLTNVVARPDFISYNLRYTKRFTTFILHRLFHVPYAVWTLRDKTSYKKGCTNFEMVIFEDPEIIMKK
ncbi:glycerophosphoryl diester phosphodiesterase [Lachnospiraceae bacterium PF1-22]